MSDTPKERDYWFKAKRYGYGWGLPQNRKGVISYAVFIGIWIAALYWFTAANPVEEPPTSDYLLLTSILVLDVVGLVFVAVKHGEPPKWRWGSKTRAKKPKSD